jgi:hypothetical protein
MRVHRPRLVAGVAGILTFLQLTVLERLPSAQQAPTGFQSGVTLVQVDVSVLDGSRMPVHGLSAADFTVKEDGRPQKISAFTEIHLADPEIPSAAWMRATPSDVRDNDATIDRRLVLIVLDDGQIRVQRSM